MKRRIGPTDHEIELLLRIEVLRAALLDAVECIEHWGDYAGDYFRQKHDLNGDIKRLRAAIERDAKHDEP